jgi:hypothetical protein
LGGLNDRTNLASTILPPRSGKYILVPNLHYFEQGTSEYRVPIPNDSVLQNTRGLIHIKTLNVMILIYVCNYLSIPSTNQTN